MAEKSQIYREKSLDRISSPEQLNDYMKVTRPAVWAVLLAVILLLAGALIWGSFAYIGSSVKGEAKVDSGKMTIYFDDSRFAENVKEGMTVTIGRTTSKIESVGFDQNGRVFAEAETDLNDGTYDARVTYKQTQVLSLLLGR